MAGPEIIWDQGTVYDLFISIEVLIRPSEFNVRAVWAAGVRARIPAEQRKVLEQSLLMFHVPFSLISHLPQPHDANSVLWFLEQTPARERLPLLALEPYWPAKYGRLLRNVMKRGSWEEEEREALGAIYREAYKHETGKHLPSHQELGIILDWWKRSEEFGERYLEALRAYQEVFFSQEERRLRPALQTALSQAKEKSQEAGAGRPAGGADPGRALWGPAQQRAGDTGALLLEHAAGVFHGAGPAALDLRLWGAPAGRLAGTRRAGARQPDRRAGGLIRSDAPENLALPGGAAANADAAS